MTEFPANHAKPAVSVINFAQFMPQLLSVTRQQLKYQFVQSVVQTSMLFRGPTV
jgi:hypothetical protein